MALPVKKLRALARQHKQGGLKFGKPSDGGEDEDEADEKAHGSEDEGDKTGGRGDGGDAEPMSDDASSDNEEADIGDDISTAHEVGQQVLNGDVSDDIVTLMEGYEEGETPDWVLDEDIWQRAVTAVDPDGDGGERYEDAWLVVAMTYIRLGGKSKVPGDEEE